MNVALHVHTNYSKCSESSVEAIASYSRQHAIDAIGITDHDRIDGAVKLREIAPWLTVIVGEEVSTRDGEIIGLFLRERIEPVQDLRETCLDWTPQLVRVIIDGEPYLEEVTQVTASNTPMYGGQFTIAPEAVIDDGLLDIMVVGRLNKVEVLEYAAAALRGGIRSLSKTHTTRAKRIEVAAAASEEIPLHADAVAVGYTPAAIEVMPGCLEVMVPREDAR